jgi:7,8-dihydropterin-6-yl-methyl-4-(beta-D-ribofuranosyl)aminobenzene 5'-phosphate synthase
MCTEPSTRHPPPQVSSPAVEWSGETVRLEPVDQLSVLSVCDNTIDALLPDQGVAHRLPPPDADTPPQSLNAVTLEGGTVIDSPLAEHGFSALVTATRAGRTHQVLFDTG